MTNTNKTTMKHLIEFEFIDGAKELYLYNDNLKDIVSKLLKSDFIDNIIEISTETSISFKNILLFEIKLNFNYDSFAKYLSNTPDIPTLKIYDFFGKVDNLSSALTYIFDNEPLSRTIQFLNMDYEYYNKLLSHEHHKILNVEYDETKKFYSDTVDVFANMKNTIKENDNIYHFNVRDSCNKIRTIEKVSRENVQKCLSNITIYDFKKKKYLDVTIDYYYGSDWYEEGFDETIDYESSDDSDDYCGSDNYYGSDNAEYIYEYSLKVQDKPRNTYLYMLIKVKVLENKLQHISIAAKRCNKNYNFSTCAHNINLQQYMKHEFDFETSNTWKSKSVNTNTETQWKEPPHYYDATNDFVLAVCHK